jgi:hypothetical protein
MNGTDLMHEYEILATLRDQSILFIEMAPETTGRIDATLDLINQYINELEQKLMEIDDDD